MIPEVPGTLCASDAPGDAAHCGSQPDCSCAHVRMRLTDRYEWSLSDEVRARLKDYASPVTPSASWMTSA